MPSMKNYKTSNLARIATAVRDFLYPEVCTACGRLLVEGEHHLCHHCLYSLPAAYNGNFYENEMAERFYGKIDFKKAAYGFVYQKESLFQQLMEALKYKGEREIGEQLGLYVGAKLRREGFFEDIDCIIPVPLHPKRLHTRGYNQSWWIAKGLSDQSHRIIEDQLLKRVVNNSSQTTRSIKARWDNTKNIFACDYSDTLQHKHILLVDDVVTSGSTLETCATSIQKHHDVQISFFALGMAK